MKVGLRFAFSKRDIELTPVLFVISCNNYVSPNGIYMNNKAYSAYPDEGELLLMEGCSVWVLAIQDQVKVKNSHADMLKYNNQIITIVHMYHEE